MKNKRTGETLKFYRRVLVNGKWKLEHRVIAEQMIGRPLKRKEVVHHIDENRLNNSPENLMVFDCQASHTAHHYGAELIRLEDGTFSSNLKEYRCACGQAMNPQSGMCLDCYNKERSSGIPDRAILADLLLSDLTMLAIAKHFQVSDNAVRKWCKKYDLPHNTKGRKEYKIKAALKQAA